MDWVADFRVLPGVCPLGAVALATSPLARDSDELLCESVMRRTKGRRPLSAGQRFDLWVLAHYQSPRSRQAVRAVLPRLLAAQRDDGMWEFEPYTGGGAVSSVVTRMFDEPLNATYRTLEMLHLSGRLPDLVARGELKGRPFAPFRRRRAIGALVARRDFEQRPAKRDAQLAQDWTAAILADQGPDGSWGRSLALTAHALHLLADLRAEKRPEVRRALKWLRGQFRRRAAMPAYDSLSRRASVALSTFGAATDALAEMELWKRINGTPGASLQTACWRRAGGAQSAFAVWALNRWGEGRRAEAREWVEQARLLGSFCGCFATNVFLSIRQRAGDIDLPPREISRCTTPEVVAAAERLLAARPHRPARR